MSPESALAQALDGRCNRATGGRIGVAVSGGGDSIALLHLTRAWADTHGFAVEAATVDHRLRPASAAEAAGVAAVCAAAGVPHQVLVWSGWDGQGNLQSAARDARRRLLTDWAHDRGLGHVLLGHTADDQAETFLMRLARGSGVDGLACMDKGQAGGLFLRPLLDVSRQLLRNWLGERGLVWVEDPSNDDLRFDRVKARAALAALAPLGLTTDRLTDTVAHMTRARRTLRTVAADFVARHVRQEAGDLILGAAVLAPGDGDTEARVLAAALGWVGGQHYRPRHDALIAAARALQQGAARTLAGVRMVPENGGARLFRELAAAQDSVASDGAPVIWDGRWRVGRAMPAPGAAAPLRIAALGEAIAQCPDWRQTGLPRASLLASPAVWQDQLLIAAPVAGWPQGWTAQIVADFRTSLVSH